MPIQLEINDSQIPLLARVYADRLSELKDLIAKFMEEKQDVEEILKKLHAPKSVAPVAVTAPLVSMVHTHVGYGGGEAVPIYDPKATIREKIKFVLKGEKLPLTSREIIDKLLVLDPALNADRHKTAKNVSTVLSILVAKGEDFDRVGDKYQMAL